MSTLKVLSKILIGITLVSALSACETTEQMRQRSQENDAAITAKVQESLAQDPVLKKYAINVFTLSGEVVLRGHVDSAEDVYRAARIVNKIKGVQSLFNDLSEKRSP